MTMVRGPPNTDPSAPAGFACPDCRDQLISSTPNGAFADGEPSSHRRVPAPRRRMLIRVRPSLEIRRPHAFAAETLTVPGKGHRGAWPRSHENAACGQVAPGIRLSGADWAATRPATARFLRNRWCGRRGSNPYSQRPRDFKSLASTSFATSALGDFNILRRLIWKALRSRFFAPPRRIVEYVPLQPRLSRQACTQPWRAHAVGHFIPSNEKGAAFAAPPFLRYRRSVQALSLAAILATWAPWNFAASSSISEGWREPSPLVMVEAP